MHVMLTSAPSPGGPPPAWRSGLIYHDPLGSGQSRWRLYLSLPARVLLGDLKRDAIALRVRDAECPSWPLTEATTADFWRAVEAEGADPRAGEKAFEACVVGGGELLISGPAPAEDAAGPVWDHWEWLRVGGRFVGASPDLLVLRDVDLREDCFSLAPPNAKWVRTCCTPSVPEEYRRALESTPPSITDAHDRPTSEYGLWGRLAKLSAWPVLLLGVPFYERGVVEGGAKLRAADFAYLGFGSNGLTVWPCSECTGGWEVARSIALHALQGGAGGCFVPFGDASPEALARFVSPALTDTGLSHSEDGRERWMLLVSLFHRWVAEQGTSGDAALPSGLIACNPRAYQGIKRPLLYSEQQAAIADLEETLGKAVLSDESWNRLRQLLTQELPEADRSAIGRKPSGRDFVIDFATKAATSGAAAAGTKKYLRSLLKKLEAAVGRRLARIFHVSDVHFGFGHRFLDKDAEEGRSELAESWLSFCRALRPGERPDLVVVSGDVTSGASTEEFARFADFLRDLASDTHPCLAEAPSGGATHERRQRILVVPGNHDVRWLGDRGDALTAFGEAAMTWGVATPFRGAGAWDVLSTLEEMPPEHAHCEVPEAAYVFDEYGVCFHLLISCYYAGGHPPEWRAVRTFLQKRPTWFDLLRPGRKHDREILEHMSERMRESRGQYTGTYGQRITATQRIGRTGSERTDLLSFAVLHHTPKEAPGFEAPFSAGGGPRLRMLLKDLGYDLALCGHYHQPYGAGGQEHGLADLLAAGSLSGKTLDLPNSFNVIDVYASPDGSARHRMQLLLVKHNSPDRWQLPGEWTPIGQT